MFFTGHEMVWVKAEDWTCGEKNAVGKSMLWENSNENM